MPGTLIFGTNTTLGMFAAGYFYTLTFHPAVMQQQDQSPGCMMCMKSRSVLKRWSGWRTCPLILYPDNLPSEPAAESQALYLRTQTGNMLLLLPEWNKLPGEQKGSFVSPLDKRRGRTITRNAPCLACTRNSL